MCGISGLLYFEDGRPVYPPTLERMNSVIRHRGPDSDGFYIRPGIGLAMRRLAIIDVEGGRQPLSNETGDIWIVFNGEIYNAPELRPALQQRGHVFRTHTDTEAIIHLYEEHGVDCVRHLRGMFAFAIWDEKRRRLLLARDRVGKKPLYYAEHDGALLFGSELKCLLEYPGFPRRAHPEAVHHFLSLQYVPEPLSALQDARKLPAAHRLIWENGRSTVERYWDLAYEPKWDAPEHELRERVRAKVTEAVRIRLMSEVPLGAHLSGGVDSAVVVGLMAGMSAQPVKTFSIGFKESAFNELIHARRVAEKFGAEHHEFLVDPSALELLPKLVSHFDEPFADAAALPTWYLSELTRAHVTVALNGDGGDEAFGGYQRYFADPFADLYRLVPAPIRNGLLRLLLTALPVDRSRPVEQNFGAALRHLAKAADLSCGASVLRWGSFFQETEKQALYTEEMQLATKGRPSHALLEHTFQNAKALSRLDRTLATDLQNYLPGALLPKVDRMTMAHSLEARSPFLDQEVLELAARLPASCKVRGFTTKRILRETFADLLPPGIAQRGKMGFSVPLGLWFAGPLAGMARETLLRPSARIHRWLTPTGLEKLLQQHASGQADHGKRIWALLNLETWMEQTGVST
jgi:asparagine synthase (glutamine-hydrolysing)